MSARVLLEFGADAEEVREAVMRNMATGRAAESPRPRAPQSPVPQAVPTGGATLFARLAPEIRERCDREPDAGDLLVVLASIEDSLIARALGELGVEDRALDHALERARAGGPSPLEERIELLRVQLREAEERHDPEAAAVLRSEEIRALRERDERLLARLRRRLGLGDEPGESSSRQGS